MITERRKEYNQLRSTASRKILSERGRKMGEKLVVQHGVKNDPKKVIERRAPNETLMEIKNTIKKSK